MKRIKQMLLGITFLLIASICFTIGDFFAFIGGFFVILGISFVTIGYIFEDNE